jgi:glycosyltransferase involved in cell wall biosynthesis
VRIASWASNYPPHPGGLEVIVRELARAQAAAGHQVSVITTAWGSGAPGITYEDGVEVRRLRALHATERLDVPYPTPIGPGVRRALLSSRHAEVHHAHGALYPTTLLAVRAAKRAGRPYLLTEHVGFVAYAKALVNLVQRLAWLLIGDRVVRGAAEVVAYNERVRSWLEIRSGRPVRLVPNGVDLETFRPVDSDGRLAARRGLGLPEAEVLLLSVGRAAAKKNLDALLGARHPSFRIVCCGAAGRSLPPDVVDLGLVPHARMPEVYRAADALVHLGVGEGFPVAMQEAAASGLPLVLLWDEGYGRSIPRADVLAVDSIADIGQCLELIASSAERRADLSSKSRAWALTSGSWNRTASDYLELYGAALRATAT